MGKRIRAFGQFSLLALVTCVLVFSFMIPSAEGKRRRSTAHPTLKILEVVPSPLSFEVGKEELTFSVVVALPRQLNGIKLLEITALISSPTQRSMRFLTQRIPLGMDSNSRSNSQVHTTLLWNGKNQAQEFVSPGTYRYEVRAKLMAEKGNRLQARVVTRRSRGTIEVTALRVNEQPAEPQEIHQIPDSPSEEERIAEQEEELLEAADETPDDEVEMLPDESTAHPLPEQGEPEASTEEEALIIPQEG